MRMNHSLNLSAACLATLVLLAVPSAVWALGWGSGSPKPEPKPEPEPYEASERVEFTRVGMSGPRFGITFVPGNTEITRRLEEHGMEPVLSQFGWHFERRITPRGGGPEFVIETVQYGKLLPSVTLAMGVRFPSGWEFGIGPNLLATGIENSEDLQTSLITAVGYNFRYSGVSLPVNLAFGTNPDGNRVSLVFGYAIRR
jgi:hypothetical protein